MISDVEPSMNQSEQVSQLNQDIKSWEEITSDRVILEFISGLKIDFISDPSTQVCYPKKISCSSYKKCAVSVKIKLYESKGIIVAVKSVEGEFISPIFPRAKRDGRTRII